MLFESLSEIFQRIRPRSKSSGVRRRKPHANSTCGHSAESLEPRELLAADLVIAALYVDYQPNGQNLVCQIIIKNEGNTTADLDGVMAASGDECVTGIIASSDNILGNADDILLKATSLHVNNGVPAVSLEPGKLTYANIAVPYSLDFTHPYLFFKTDLTGEIAEGAGHEGNNYVVRDLRAPNLEISPSPRDVPRGDRAKVLFQLRVIDYDSATLPQGELNVAITNPAKGESIRFRTGNGIRIAGNRVFVFGEEVGALNTPRRGQQLKMTMAQNATAHQVALVMAAVEFKAGLHPVGTLASVKFQVSDGTGHTGNLAIATMKYV